MEGVTIDKVFIVDNGVEGMGEWDDDVVICERYINGDMYKGWEIMGSFSLVDALMIVDEKGINDRESAWNYIKLAYITTKDDENVLWINVPDASTHKDHVSIPFPCELIWEDGFEWLNSESRLWRMYKDHEWQFRTGILIRECSSLSDLIRALSSVLCVLPNRLSLHPTLIKKNQIIFTRENEDHDEE